MYTLFSGQQIVSHVVDTGGQTIRTSGLALSSGDECDANAHLIAAAPELMEALDSCLRYLVPRDSLGDKAVVQARAAIRKATGAAK